MTRTTSIALAAVVVTAACHMQTPASPSAIPVLPLSLGAEAPAAERPAVLPLGAAAGGPTACPSGSPRGPTCLQVTVTAPAGALLRVDRPTGDARGTILLTTDGDGLMFARSNAVSPLAARMIARLVADGVLVVEVAWRPGVWGGPRARTRACAFATLARWLYVNVHEGGRATPFAAQGTGGGASQIAFALAHYGLGEYLTLANLGGGPLVCPLCVPDGDTALEPLLPAARLAYPATAVRVFLGDQEPDPAVAADARMYLDAIESDKALTIVPGTGHTIEQTSAGVDAYVSSVRAHLR